MIIAKSHIKRECVKILQHAYQLWQDDMLGPNCELVPVWTAPGLDREIAKEWHFSPDIPSDRVMYSNKPHPKSDYKKMSSKEAQEFDFSIFDHKGIIEHFVDGVEQHFQIQIPTNPCEGSNSPDYPFGSLSAYVDYIYKTKNNMEIEQGSFICQIYNFCPGCDTECYVACYKHNAPRIRAQTNGRTDIAIHDDREIDPNLCNGCGECIKACPQNNVSLLYIGQNRPFSKSQRT